LAVGGGIKKMCRVKNEKFGIKYILYVLLKHTNFFRNTGYLSPIPPLDPRMVHLYSHYLSLLKEVFYFIKQINYLKVCSYMVL